MVKRSEDSSSTGEPGNESAESANQDEATFVTAANNPAVVDVTAEDTANVAEPGTTKCSCGAFEWGSQDAAMAPTVLDAPGDDGKVVRHTPDECRPLDEVQKEQAEAGYGTDTTGTEQD